MLTATLRLFSEESGSSDYSPKTGETIAEICRSGQYNGCTAMNPATGAELVKRPNQFRVARNEFRKAKPEGCTASRFS